MRKNDGNLYGSGNPDGNLQAVSDATKRNWERLNTDAEGRLESRANKRNSRKRILPVEYFSDKKNIGTILEILSRIDRENIGITQAIISLGINLLKRAGIYGKDHVMHTLDEYKDIPVLDDMTEMDIPENEQDLLGLVYQAYLMEGKKNASGSYYTPSNIVSNMVSGFDMAGGKTFLDPCCGSGAFLLSVKADDPGQLFGMDNDRTAVLIARMNMLLKYRENEFIPQIYEWDFLEGNNLLKRCDVFYRKFDFIATNPPWGAVPKENYVPGPISSKETFSYFFVRSFGLLKEGGHIRFLFPESVLNVKVHKDIRQYILETAGLSGITVYHEQFSGVTTHYIDIECTKGTISPTFEYHHEGKTDKLETSAIYETENLVFNLLGKTDLSIIKAVKRKGKYTLADSIWALGIVTGDNKNKIFPEAHAGMEEIYTGKEIEPYRLKPAKNWILYDRNSFQQAAKDEIYRAKEKLVYRFISDKLVFAYDTDRSLFLNSANILIPSIPHMDIKTVMAFLNSELFRFLYIRMFGEVKILKGNLSQIPFPRLTRKQDETLRNLVTEILDGDPTKKADIDEYIFSLYRLNGKQTAYIKEAITC